MPVDRRNAAGTPVEGNLVGDAKKTRQGGGSSKKLDDDRVVHARDLRRYGVDVKHYYADLALDTEPTGVLEGTMIEAKRDKSPEEILWEKKCAERVRWVREISGFNQTQVAKMIGVGQQAVSSYETGNRSLDPYVMLRFCARFRTTLDYVYRGKLEGTHPGLVRLLLAEHPELNQPPTGKEPGKDTILDEYREAIKGNQAQ